MTPADRIREVLAAHGVDENTVSLNGPRTLLGDVLDDAMEEHAEAWRLRAWDTLRNLERTLARAEAAEARHRRHLARLRWRLQRPRMMSNGRDLLLWRAQCGPYCVRAYIRGLPISGPFPGDSKRPAGVLPG